MKGTFAAEFCIFENQRLQKSLMHRFSLLLALGALSDAARLETAYLALCAWRWCITSLCQWW